MIVSQQDALRDGFLAAFGLPASHLVRAPGRLNLIGEHTDYSGLPVLPIAIEQSVYVAAAATDDGKVTAVSRQFDGLMNFARVTEHPHVDEPWQHYLRAAVEQLPWFGQGKGVRLSIDSALPGGGGLSSSSALMMAVLEALNLVWEAGLSRDELVSRAIAAERLAGAETGGMDQTIIAFADAGHALRIDFLPPSRKQIALPPGLSLVVAYSGESAPKAGTARDAYNERVVGSRIAASMLADEVGVDLDETPTLGQVAGVDVVEILADGLPEKISAQEVAHGVRLDVERLVRLSSDRWDHLAKVPVRRIALHVLSEAQRVDQAEAALSAADLKAFGALLDASHDSLRQDMRCSTPALDKVCAAMRKAGAYGARLTGAGFGGHAFAAAPPDQVPAIIEAAIAATGGPAFEVHASGAMETL